MLTDALNAMEGVELRFPNSNPVQLAQAAAIQYPFDPMKMFAALRTSLSVYADTQTGILTFKADKGKTWSKLPFKQVTELMFKDKRFIRYPFQNYPIYSKIDSIREADVSVAFQANKGTSVMAVLVSIRPTEITVMYATTNTIELYEETKELGEFLATQLK